MASPQQGWSKIYDGWYQHPKFLQVSAAAAALYWAGQAYCSFHGTDGRIPKAVVATFFGARGASRKCRELVDVGLWNDNGADTGDCYEQHDYCEMQTTSEEREVKRKQQRERVQKFRGKQAGNADVTRYDDDGNALVTQQSRVEESRTEQQQRTVSTPVDTDPATPPVPDFPTWVSDIVDAWEDAHALPARTKRIDCLKAVHDLHRIDKHSPDEIAEVITWIIGTGKVEQGYIRTPTKLRKPNKDGDSQTYAMYRQQMRAPAQVVSGNGRPQAPAPTGEIYDPSKYSHQDTFSGKGYDEPKVLSPESIARGEELERKHQRKREQQRRLRHHLTPLADDEEWPPT